MKTMISSPHLRSVALVYIAAYFFSCHPQTELSQGLAGYWPLSGDISDKSGNDLQTIMHGSVQLNVADANSQSNSAASFDGRSAWLEVPANPKLQLGTGDFSVAGWIHTEEALDDVPGDIISQYDPSSRKGFHLSLKTNDVTTNPANTRQLDFGIDDNLSSTWEEYGRPGNALLAFGLVNYKGELYAATCEAGATERGHVYRYTGDRKWVDCGFLDSSNSVISFAVLNGELYAGTGHYRVGGSSLPESENIKPGGRVFRYVAPDKWEDCGQLPEVDCIGGMVVYNGKLYATSMKPPASFYRYEGGKEWVDCGVPDGKRVVNMAVYDGYLYATSWDWGHVYRYDGNTWTDCGQVGEEKVNTQTYAFAVYRGNLYVATWASGRVYRFDGIKQWTDIGRLGEELEVMGMLVHNGRLIAGTLPLGEVYSYEGDTTWLMMDQLDKTPDVKYRRVWTMAEYDGKVFCSTLPSGKIYGYEAGKSVMSPDEISAGWQHVAAIKTADRLRLFVNGKIVSETKIPDSVKMNLNNGLPLQIGFGPNDYFNGRLRELRLYNRALNEREIRALSTK
ncbi:MAG: LamG domain-containing protein [Chitinophagaceae bacterium]|nr:LamG domain-containing protein [Chitinophagaceae bacterium]